MSKYLLVTLLFFQFIGINRSTGQTYSKETILISTAYGNMKVKLFNETPGHRNNFLKLVKQGFYDSLLFHRVIDQFMIQGGDPYSKLANDTSLLGDGDVDYWIPAEFNRKLFHRKGMLAAAREGDDVNPNKESSGSQFYIVMGKTYEAPALRKAELRINKDLVRKINYNVAFSGKSSALRSYYNRLLAEEKEDSLKYATQQLTDPISVERYEKTPHFTFTAKQQKTYATQAEPRIWI
ncbi:MAG: peptidylprolyl isomerase [Chitinophagaceae bacterium]|nr:peptidylprolyl isomerase [Chitinophagaceae bacterium]